MPFGHEQPGTTPIVRYMPTMRCWPMRRNSMVIRWHATLPIYCYSHRFCGALLTVAAVVYAHDSPLLPPWWPPGCLISSAATAATFYDCRIPQPPYRLYRSHVFRGRYVAAHCEHAFILPERRTTQHFEWWTVPTRDSAVTVVTLPTCLTFSLPLPHTARLYGTGIWCDYAGTPTIWFCTCHILTYIHIPVWYTTYHASFYQFNSVHDSC